MAGIALLGGCCVNGSLGGGTLVHEMVHALMEANFDDAPTWFDEGLASLFEQPGERDGHIVGLTNWRLPSLQRAIRVGRVKPLRELMETSRWTFYDAERGGLHYAVARYLLFYLQERGLLVPYYRRFRTNVAGDSSGIASLLAVTGEYDLAALQHTWEAYVLGLSFVG
jgi:hypothetical protein